MHNKGDIIQCIRSSLNTTEPGATVILFGSYARGDYKNDSDIDLLILLDKEKITHADAKRVAYSLYDIEFETGKIISPLILSKKRWESKHKITPFYKNIQKEGVIF